MLKRNIGQLLKGRSVREAFRLFIGFVTLACAIGLVSSAWTPAFGSMQDDDDEDDDRRENRGCILGGGEIAVLPTTKLFIEHNATDGDTGVHGAFDGIDWQRLCVFDPRGRLILDVAPQGQLRDLSISGIFFESREPENDEVSLEELLDAFPEGLYRVRGRGLEGERLTGAATFTHDIPAAPSILFPDEDEMVSPAGFLVGWNHVTTTLDGRPLNRTGYEVIITKDVPDDPHGFSRPTYDVHLPASETSLWVPEQFLEPGTRYELEVLALEVSGNQTISVLFFETQE